jgi:hypothetical protein
MWKKLSQFIVFGFLVTSVASADEISQLDGDWYSFKWKYGYSLSNGKGVAFATNSPNFKVGQEIVRLSAVGKNAFVGENIYKDGKFYKVKVTLQPDGKLLFEGEKNVKWEMEKIDPETYSSIVNAKPEKQAKSKPEKSAPKNDPKPADVDLFCSGMLARTSGLINENLGQFSGDDKKAFTQLSDHLSNNGMLLMQRGVVNGGDLENTNLGMRFANEKIGNNFRALVTDGSDQKKAVMGCLKRNQ